MRSIINRTPKNGEREREPHVLDFYWQCAVAAHPRAWRHEPQSRHDRDGAGRFGRVHEEANMGRRTPSCVLASLVIAATVALAGCASTSGNRMKVDSIVVFGDSYSDVGTYGV